MDDGPLRVRDIVARARRKRAEQTRATAASVRRSYRSLFWMSITWINGDIAMILHGDVVVWCSATSRKMTTIDGLPDLQRKTISSALDRIRADGS